LPQKGEEAMSEVIQLELVLAGLLGCLFGVAVTCLITALVRRRQTTAIERAGIWRVGPRAYRLGRLDNEGIEELVRRRKDVENSEPVVKMPLRSTAG
jgi:hypothetical protein